VSRSCHGSSTTLLRPSPAHRFLFPRRRMVAGRPPCGTMVQERSAARRLLHQVSELMCHVTGLSGRGLRPEEVVEWTLRRGHWNRVQNGGPSRHACGVTDEATSSRGIGMTVLQAGGGHRAPMILPGVYTEGRTGARDPGNAKGAFRPPSTHRATPSLQAFVPGLEEPQVLWFIHHL
jgi:hypothetical protein